MLQPGEAELKVYVQEWGIEYMETNELAGRHKLERRTAGTSSQNQKQKRCFLGGPFKHEELIALFNFGRTTVEMTPGKDVQSTGL